MSHSSAKRVPILLAVGMAGLMVFVLASVTVEAAPLTASSTPVGSWSYGAVRSISVGPMHGADGWTYEGNATFGYTVSIYENNTSATTFEVSASRTMGASFSLRFCLPSCSSPQNWVNLSYRAWESTNALANFTNQGTVVEGGVSVPAIAIENSSVWVRANLTESFSEHLPRMGFLVDHMSYLSADISGHASVNFSPSLGLFPLQLNSGSSWSSTSEFSTYGEANYTYCYATTGMVFNAHACPVGGPISVSQHGNVTLQGAYNPGSTVDLGGVTYPAISLTVVGPFSVREGIIFVPNMVDVFGAPERPWAGNASGAASVSQSNVDVKPSANGHFDLGASSWRYASNSVNPADGASPGMISGLSAAVLTSNPVSSTTVQGEPETAAQATDTQQCLTGGNGCPVPSGTGLGPHSFLGAVVVIGAIASVGALIALAVVERRRRIPPPTYPNAALYPPGAAGTPTAAPATPGAPPPPEDDPLDHLW
ncbi:MAG TPA: hypothetical protein VK423_04385 [Thermoplasmata archaeon]|nr:hypothetical protein [Thermoplasmata archaeon]